MTSTMHPPANTRCQLYSEATSVRCINTGTHWVKWGNAFVSTRDETREVFDTGDFYSWECDGPHLYGDARTTAIPTQRKAA